MWVELGNAKPVEGLRLRGDARLHFRSLPGPQVTRMEFPEGTSVSEASHIVVAAVRYHFSKGTRPEWVESDSDELQQVLTKQFGLDPETTRPADWPIYEGAT